MPFGSTIVRLIVCSAILLTVGVAARPGALAGPSPGPSPSPSASPSPSPTGPPECRDDFDNDGDGFIDFDGGPKGKGKDNDPGCDSLDDNSEAPYNPCACIVEHSRVISITGEFHVTNKVGRSLAFSGSVETVDGTEMCSSHVPLKLQLFVDGRWKTTATGRTSEDDLDGNDKYPFRISTKDRTGRYRITAVKIQLNPAPTELLICLKAMDTARHRHGR